MMTGWKMQTGVAGSEEVGRKRCRIKEEGRMLKRKKGMEEVGSIAEEDVMGAADHFDWV